MTSNSKSATDLNAQRRRAVQLRLAGSTLAVVRAEVGLSTPTIVAAVKAFKSGGWAAVDVKPRGRPRLNESRDSDTNLAHAQLTQTLSSEQSASLWSTLRVADWLKKEQCMDVSQQTAASYLQTWQLLPANLHRKLSETQSTGPRTWLNGEYKDFKAQAKNRHATVLWAGLRTTPNGDSQLYAHTLRGRVLWMQITEQPSSAHYKQFFTLLNAEFAKGLALVLSNKHLRAEADKFTDVNNTQMLSIVSPTSTQTIETANRVKTNIKTDTTTKRETKTCAIKTDTNLEPSNKPINSNRALTDTNTSNRATKRPLMTQPLPGTTNTANDALEKQPRTVINNKSAIASNALPAALSGLTHLQRLEAESIQIMREVVAEADNPVMMYSVGKDSAVMLHLARKAFYPASPPFPLLHVDTTWKFQEMYRFRDDIVKELGFELITHVNPEGIEKNVNPFTHGSGLHTDIMKTQGLKQALDKHGFDVAFGGARRDEEKSRAKERVFSFRTSQHRWEPKDQRPELWNLYNTRKQPGESIRVFPISNWTELDIWQYIHSQNIPIVPLYFAAERPVVERDGMLIMVDDDRMPLLKDEVPMMRSVRFRTLGCYPLTGAVESTATTLPEIIQEMLLAKTSERQGRMIDHDAAASMEKKKQEGYF